MRPEIEAPVIDLLPMDPAQLRQLCNRESVDWGEMRVQPEALPSQKSIVRALSQWQAGVPAKWCLPYLILTPHRDQLIGGCGFKGVPIDGTVEIYYGIAPTQRRQGIGTQALHHLLRIAAMDDDVERVIAHILPRNIASLRLVQRVGFRPERRFMDTQGEVVEQWQWVKHSQR